MHHFGSCLVACLLVAGFGPFGHLAANEAAAKKKKQPMTAEQFFQLKDTDKSGGLSKEELKVRIKKKQQEDQPQKAGKGGKGDFEAFNVDDIEIDKNTWNNFFEQADKNVNGELQFNEWLHFRELKRTEFFRRINNNDDGVISFKEFRKWANRKVPDSELDEFEQEERRERQRKRFNKIDADNDGEISLDEFLSAHRWGRKIRK